MALSRRLSFLAAVLAAAVLVFAPQPSRAHETKAGPLTISSMWTRATVGTTRPGVAYFTVTNTGTEPDRIVAASSPLAARVEMHRSLMKNGMMTMEAVEALEVPAGGKLTLAPGGYHLMLLGLRQPLVAGQMLPLTLIFAHQGKVAIRLHIKALGAGKDMKMKGMSGMGH